MTIPDVTPDPPSARWRLLLALLKRLPQAGLSRGMGRIADLSLPRSLRAPVLKAFARAFGIDRSEAELPLEAYPSINAFFVRRLREGARSWPSGPGLASPVDGIVGAAGRIDAGRLIQAKGRSYLAADLVDDEKAAGRYDGGWFVTLYLSPRHYHRIHAPVGGAIQTARHVPGSLLPVNEAAVSHVDDLFARNERLVCPIDGAHGRVAVVAVGAYNVGRISAAFDPAWSGDDSRPWVTNRREPPPRSRRYDPARRVERGEEIMAFHLGSTVVLLTERGRWEPTRACRSGREIALGELLARPAGDAEPTDRSPSA